MFKMVLSCLLLVTCFFVRPSFSDPVVAGPLELTPIDSSLVIMKANDRVQLYPTIRFSFKNKSSSDIRVILIKSNINAYDNLNQQLFATSIKSSGVPLSKAEGTDKIFINDKSDFVSLSPNQIIQVYIDTNPHNQGQEIRDPSGDFYKTHRPTTLTFNGSFGIINLDGSTDVRSFSLSDIPVSVSNR